MQYSAYHCDRGGYPSYLQRQLRSILPCSIVHTKGRGSQAFQSGAPPDSSKTEVLGSSL
jgi:hypothetical protein